ncbi:MAG: hypothetical protein AAGA77_05785 [Bacteroidota bacterium]
MKTGIITKAIILLLVSFLTHNTSAAQKAKPQKIYGIAKEDKSESYYKEQSEWWRIIIDHELDNEEAWVNYYLAQRSYLQLSQPNLWANDKNTFYQKLDPILRESKPHIGDKFEYHYMQGINSSDAQALKSFEKAYAIDPERSEAHGWLFTQYIPMFKDKECKDLARRMLKNNAYSDANLKWNYNALQSLDQNGVIISNGDMDGLPKWVLQYGDNVRPDVLITNKWLLADIPNYKKKIYARLNLTLPSKNIDDFDSLSEYADFLTVDILKRSNRPTYISAGTQLKFFKANGIEDNMYLVGNVLKYSETSFDNTSELKNNFENKYFLEYLFKNFQHHSQDEVVKSQMNLTYLPGLIHLKKHYASLKNQEKANYYNALIERIVEDSGKKTEVLGWFGN